MSDIKVAFWNLQNLFDTKASEIAADLEFTPSEGWTQPVLNAKLNNLADVIKSMDNGQGPDLLGICEVETKELAEKLMNKCNRPDYALAHISSPDIRGIDVALIYSKDVFELPVTNPANPDNPIAHLIHLRYPTRDIFQVKLKVKENDSILHVLVNHWPSRWKGKFLTEAYRLATANSCGHIIDRLLKFSRKDYLGMPDTQTTLDKLNDRWNENILVMGDFNDEPFNRSITRELQASSGEDKLEEPLKKSSGRNTPSPKAYLQKQAYMFNCMYQFIGEKDLGTYFYSEATNTMNVLDQFIISRGMFYGYNRLKMNPDSVEIFQPNIMTSTKKRPKRFDKKTTKGYSDHFPIMGIIETV